ncbi:MAG: PilZ domain-containing protein [Syntrophobacteria bacterium]
MSQERRIYPRAKMKWPVIVKTDEGSMDGVTSDVTPNGVFIHCQKPLRLNMVFEMSISIPNSEHSITAKAEVVWSNRWGPDDEISPRGMGVRFVKISSEARKFIARAAMNNLKSKEVAPELLQTLQTLVIEIDETKSQAA